MSPDFIGLRNDDTVARAIEKVRSSDLAPGTLTTVYLCNTEGGLTGSVPVVTLLRADARRPWRRSPSTSRYGSERTPICPRWRAR